MWRGPYTAARKEFKTNDWLTYHTWFHAQIKQVRHRFLYFPSLNLVVEDPKGVLTISEPLLEPSGIIPWI